MHRKVTTAPSVQAAKDTVMPQAPDFSPEALERAQLLAWAGLSTQAKIAFFKEMIELAWRSGALAPERLAMRDQAGTGAKPH